MSGVTNPNTADEDKKPNDPSAAHINLKVKASEHPFKGILTSLPKPGGGEFGKFYSLPGLNDPRIDKLPYSIRILLESAIRNCDGFQVKEDVEKIIDWENSSPRQVEIPFKPARVLLQDFTGVPAVVDLAAMRDAMNKLGIDPNKINPLVPVDLVIDHSVQVDAARSENAVQSNMEFEFQRNKERFGFLKWGSSAFRNMLVVPPGSGIVHQVNLEYLGRVVFNTDGIMYPDSVVGTDSHTTMVDGLGVAGWGVGGIEAEATMLGQPMSMVLPGVVGFKLDGKLRDGVTATDLVLTVTQMLRKHGVVGKFVEFYGDGVAQLSLADRATIANMSPEYGATMGFFPIDHVILDYLLLTGRSDETISFIFISLTERTFVLGLATMYVKTLKQINLMGNPVSITSLIHRRLDCYSWCGGLGGSNDETVSFLGGIGDAGGYIRGGRRASIGVFSCKGPATGADDDGGESRNENGAGNASDVVPRIKFKRLDKTARHIMQILNKEAVEEVKAQRDVPDIRPGYIVQLKVEVPENKRRITTIKGIVIARRNSGISTTFRIRRLVAGVGVESLFPLYSPNIKEIKVLDKKKVRRAKLYYLRDKMNALKK